MTHYDDHDRDEYDDVEPPPADPGDRADLEDLLAEPASPAPRPRSGRKGTAGPGVDPVERRLVLLTEFWGHGDPGVFAWMDADPATRHAALIRLARFVEWVISTFEVREIKPCWTAHPSVVVELWALERLHHATHVTNADDGAAPVVFYNQLPVTRARLRTDTGMDACTTTDHTVPVRELADRVAARRATYDTTERWTATWAWPSVDDAGESVVPPPHAQGPRP
ncbi:hypothetical protein [Cellulomonas triticagri]|uniref:DUF4913 domain-containing protein n=1 Tax=Cellulomonas triticagri TaxID=2483352 RepID=A0A3M2JNM7_9CELL|nr:hypothetical protein [Cellulomonas triticagri]RMI13223.1 hypothetical protein EBM89_05200 [Cellulomonas triticagri]